MFTENSDFKNSFLGLSMNVILKEAIEHLSMINTSTQIFYNPENGEYIVNDWDNPDLCTEEIDLPDGSVKMPDYEEIALYDIMTEFAEYREDIENQELLLTALDGKGAFRRFKDTVNSIGLSEQWYEFENAEYERIIRRWCSANEFLIEEDENPEEF
jgi:hypothetical protein